jgi:C1A family cysteine protease
VVAPATVDLRQWCSAIEDQQSLGSCTAHAAVGLMEYFERKAFGKHIDASRLFVYKVTRDLIGVVGDTGAQLRNAMQALATFGAPPERYWPYRIADFEKEPSAFCYQFAADFKSLQYFRLDPPGTTPAALLQKIKETLVSGLPSMFGFTVYDSIPGVGAGTGNIPFPAAGNRQIGGHAIIAVGYDDRRVIGPDTGALLIRNSWGVSWGDRGYGWLPYRYVLAGLATDFWSLVRAEFLDSDLFR